LIEYNSYNITLKIKGTGTKQIFSSNSRFTNYPNEVYINGNKQNVVTHSYNLNQEDNFIELIWNNLINSCVCMFFECSDITEIDFSNFNTSNVEYMNQMFYGCSSLTSLNLSNFETSKVKSMWSTFNRCSSLTSLNLSNFDTSQVTEMDYMFKHCSSLTSLNLSNFDTSQVTNVEYMFDGCKNLEYINMINFKDSSLTTYSHMFEDVPDNIVLCINKDNIPKIYIQIKDKSCHIEDCSDDWKLKQNKTIEGTNEYINNCSERNLYEYKCISQCPDGYYNDDNNNIKCKCELDKGLTCPRLALNNNLCTKCNEHYYPMENDPSNLEEYFNCYNEAPYGYYLDKNESLYKKCYYTCETCEIKGDNEFHNCLKCNTEFNFTISINNYINCYENCCYFYYVDNNNNYHCTKSNFCPPEYPTLIEEQNKCIKNDLFKIDNIIDELFIKYKNNTTIEDNKNEKQLETNYYNEILTNVESILTNNNFDTSNLDEGKEKVINTKKMTITLTTTNTEKNNLNNTNNNITILVLGQCENDLRAYYNLSDDETLYMEKLDIDQPGLKISKIEYRIYCKLHGSNLIRLNISVCKNSKIFLSIPIELNEDMNKINTSSDYFNNPCSTTTSNSDTDISLRDRQREYVEGDKIICQEDCNFAYYNSTTKHANCSCDAKESSDNFANMNINKDRLYENFGDSNKKDSTNFGVASCNLFDSTENIKSNTGFFLLLIILAIFIIVSIVFCSKGYNLLMNKMDEVIYKKFKNKSNSQINKIKKNFQKRKSQKKKQRIKL